MWCYLTPCSISMSENGWTDNVLCKEWFTESFLPQATERQKQSANPDTPILLIYDGHGSHDQYSLIQEAMDNNVYLLCLPPHMCSLLMLVSSVPSHEHGMIVVMRSQQKLVQKCPIKTLSRNIWLYEMQHLNILPLYLLFEAVAYVLSIPTSFPIPILPLVNLHR